MAISQPDNQILLISSGSKEWTTEIACQPRTETGMPPPPPLKMVMEACPMISSPVDRPMLGNVADTEVRPRCKNMIT